MTEKSTKNLCPCSFLLAAVHLYNILVIDSIERTTEPLGFRVRCHALHGDLPEVFVRDNGDRFAVLEEIRTEAAEICAIVKLREDLAAVYPGCHFPPHTIADNGVMVGLHVEGRTVVAEAPTFC